MRRTGSFLAIALTVAAMPAAAQAQDVDRSPNANIIPGEYVVVYDGDAESVRAETDQRERALGFEAELRYRHAIEGFSGELTPGQVRALKRDPEVATVVPDRAVRATGQVPASGESVPTGVRRIRSGTSSTIEHASGVGVAVLDSGVDLTHPDLNVADGTNCMTPGTPADDDNGHGTHVAGTVAAENDGAGVVGVAPGTKIWAVKVLDSAGQGSFSNIICGLDWVTGNAASKGIKVLNMSLGATGSPVGTCATTGDPLHRAVCRTIAAGVVNVVAAGNEGWDFDHPDTPDVPAAYPEVLTVTAMSDTDGQGGALAPFGCGLETDDAPASFSNFADTAAGRAHAIAAPGVCIRSTWPTDLAPAGGFRTASGTSMAAPHVAALAALCVSHDGTPGLCSELRPADVITKLRTVAAAYSASDRSFGFSGSGPYGYLANWIDTEPPDTSIPAHPGELTAAASARFRFASTEPRSTYECKVDADAWASCGEAVATADLVDGAHSMSVRAVDAVGHVDPSPATHTWKTDTTAPDAVFQSGPPAMTTARSATLVFAAAEEATYLCRLDYRWFECSSPHAVTDAPDGSHTLTVIATDAAGNRDASPANYSWVVDTVGPDVAIGSGPSEATASRSAEFRFESPEPDVTFECRLDGRRWTPCESAHTVDDLGEGSHVLSVRAIDPAGNATSSPATRSWTVLPAPARLRASLARDLAALGKALPTMARLLRARGFKARGLDALLPGTFSVELTGNVAGAGTARSVVLARGSRSVERAGRYALKVKLTRQGRRFLRGDRRARVRLVVAYSDVLGRTTIRQKTLRLRR